MSTEPNATVNFFESLRPTTAIFEGPDTANKHKKLGTAVPNNVQTPYFSTLGQSADYMGHTIPSMVQAGQSVSPTIKLKNIGANPWQPGRHWLYFYIDVDPTTRREAFIPLISTVPNNGNLYEIPFQIDSVLSQLQNPTGPIELHFLMMDRRQFEYNGAIQKDRYFGLGGVAALTVTPANP